MSRYCEPFHLALSPSECVDLVRILTERAAETHASIARSLRQTLDSDGYSAAFHHDDETLVDLWEAESLTALARATMEAFCPNPQPKRVEFITREDAETITVTRGSEDVATIAVPCHRIHGVGTHLQPYISRAYNGNAF